MRTADMQYLLWYRNISANFTVKTAGVTGLSSLCKGRRTQEFLVKIVFLVTEG